MINDPALVTVRVKLYEKKTGDECRFFVNAATCRYTGMSCALAMQSVHVMMQYRSHFASESRLKKLQEYDMLMWVYPKNEHLFDAIPVYEFAKIDGYDDIGAVTYYLVTKNSKTVTKLSIASVAPTTKEVVSIFKAGGGLVFDSEKPLYRFFKVLVANAKINT